MNIPQENTPHVENVANISEKTLLEISEVCKRITEIKAMKNKPIVVAVDGRSGTGKSTISALIAESTRGVLINTDDFWSGGSDEEWEAKDPQTRADRAIDWQRLKREVIEPFLSAAVVQYFPFNFQDGSGLSASPIVVQPADIIILDGAYSSRPELEDLIDFSILVISQDDAARRRRLILREGLKYMQRWHRLWDPAESHYFTHIRPSTAFDAIITNG